MFHTGPMTPVEIGWRRPFTSSEANRLHAEAFDTRVFDDDEWDWVALVESNSLGWVTARLDGELVGFANVVTDGFVHAWLQDVMVHPTRQRTGIGIGLVNEVSARVRAAGCEWLHVDFDDDVADFYYRRCGFQPTNGGLLDLQSPIDDPPGAGVVTTRPAEEGDLDAIVALSATARARLAQLEPVCWRPHPRADANQRGWFGLLLNDPAHHLVVSIDGDDRIDGFIVARATDAPPVYDPGGRTCLIDDLVAPSPEGGTELIDAVRRWARTGGCTQLVVVTPTADPGRRALLGRSGLHPTSEWWTGPI